MYILGWGLPWRLTTLPGALIPILPILLLALLPETPTWLLGKGRREDALQSLAKYVIVVKNILIIEHFSWILSCCGSERSVRK